MAKTIKLVALLKLSICQECPDAVKRKLDEKLMCNWPRIEGEKQQACENVPSCGNWPDYFANEDFESIRMNKP